MGDTLFACGTVGQTAGPIGIVEGTSGTPGGLWRSHGSPARACHGLHPFVALELRTFPLGLLARPPAHITELPDSGVVGFNLSQTTPCVFCENAYPTH